MDDHPHQTGELNSSAQLDEQGSRDQSISAFFMKSRQFTISGGVFTNNITNIHQTPLSDFRMIPLGDLNLLREIQWDPVSGGISRRQGRVYSARISGGESNVTVSVYQGDNAGKKWREAISTYANLRHPNIVQVYGVTVSSGIHATVFHDDLIPWKRVEQQYRCSPNATMYFWYFLGTEFDQAVRYMSSVTGNHFTSSAVLWIRPSTGRLCVELAPDANDEGYEAPWFISFPDHIDLLKPDQASEMIDLMPLKDYHKLCVGWYDDRHTSWEASSPVKLGSVLTPSGMWIDLAIPPEPYYSPKWQCENSLIMENGWTRVHYIEPIYATCAMSSDYRDSTAWVSQAEYIFNCLNIDLNHLEYAVLVDCIQYEVLSEPRNHSPQGFLFLCPTTDLRIVGDGTVLQHLDSIAYWSLDPAGIDHLCAKDANDLGFPAIELKTKAHGRSWNGSVYDGLREVHQAKGFDPDSQDIARHMGYPLYNVSPGADPRFAYDEEYGFTDEDVNSLTPRGSNIESEEDDEPVCKQVNRTSPDESLQADAETSTLCDFELAETLQPSQSLTVIMLVQFALILTLSAFWLYDNVSTCQLEFLFS